MTAMEGTGPVASWLETAARDHGPLPAAVFEGHVLSWKDLSLRVEETVSWLSGHGIRRGHVVGVLAENSLVWPRWLHALAACRAPLLALNSRLTTDELCFQLGDAQATVLVLGPDVDAQRADAIATRCSGLRVIRVSDHGELIEIVSSPARTSEAGFAECCDESLPLCVLYTSGTTGRPKGVLLSASAFAASARGSQAGVPLEPGDRWLVCMPLFHVGGLSVLVRAALAGATAIIHRGFDAEAVARALDHDGVTHVSFVATMLERVMAARSGAAAPASLRHLLLGGGPASGELIRGAWQLGYPVSPTYGLTEACSQVATRAPGDREGPVAGRLRVLPGLEVRVRDGDGALHGADAEGEIMLRGGAVTRGYAGHAAEREPVDPSGWLATGDIGRLDGEGLVEVLDRREDLIVSGGENIYPAEIEAALLLHEAVAEAAVISRPDSRFGARPVAYWGASATVEDVSSEVLEAHLRLRLAGYKVPVEFIRLDELPRTATGKLQRAALRALDDERAHRA